MLISLQLHLCRITYDARSGIAASNLRVEEWEAKYRCLLRKGNHPTRG